MNHELLWVLGLLAIVITLFVINRPRMDVVALLVILALPLLGILTVEQALAGFSDPNVVLIAALFVIGEGLVRTGIAYRIGEWMSERAGNSEARLLVLLMVAVAGLGSIMSSTGVVAIFIPVVLSIAARLQLSPSRLMMPLAFAGLISGMLSLVATPPNVVVHSELVRHGEGTRQRHNNALYCGCFERNRGSIKFCHANAGVFPAVDGFINHRLPAIAGQRGALKEPVTTVCVCHVLHAPR